MDSTARLQREAARRHGVITRAEAHAAGLSNRQIRLRVETGRWRRHSRDVFIVAGAPPTPHQTLRAASERHRAPASHLSAAWLHGLRAEPPGTAHVARARSTSSGSNDEKVTVHRLVDLRERDLVTVASIRTTNVTRTLLDLAPLTTEAELHTLIDRARRAGLTHPDALVTRFLSHGRPGRPGSARARQVLAALDRDLSLVESDLESLLLALIAAAGLAPPVAQHRIRIGDAEYRIDFAYPTHQIAIEGDGFEFHSERERFESDRVRQNHLVLAGWLVLRFTWRQIVRRPEEVAAQIETALAARNTGVAPR